MKRSTRVGKGKRRRGRRHKRARKAWQRTFEEVRRALAPRLTFLELTFLDAYGPSSFQGFQHYMLQSSRSFGCVVDPDVHSCPVCDMLRKETIEELPGD
jgi:hypothetical protein